MKFPLDLFEGNEYVNMSPIVRIKSVLIKKCLTSFLNSEVGNVFTIYCIYFYNYGILKHLVLHLGWRYLGYESLQVHLIKHIICNFHAYIFNLAANGEFRGFAILHCFNKIRRIFPSNGEEINTKLRKFAGCCQEFVALFPRKMKPRLVGSQLP